VVARRRRVLSIVFGAVVAIWPGSGALAIPLVDRGLYSIVLGGMRLVFAYRVHTAQTTVRRAVGSVGTQS